MRFPPYAPLTIPRNPLKRLFGTVGVEGFEQKSFNDRNRQSKSLVLRNGWNWAANPSALRLGSEVALMLLQENKPIFSRLN